MTDLEIRRAARRRLFEASLAEVLGATAPRGAAWTERATASPSRSFAAALLLLGALATAGAWLLHGGRTDSPAQDPLRFDPIFPVVEQDAPWNLSWHQVPSTAQLEALPDAAIAIAVTARDPELVVAAAQRPGVTALALGDGDPFPIEVWRGIGEMQDLRILDIGGSVTADGVRELRRAPQLRTVLFSGPRHVFSREIALALTELPKLSCVMFALVEVHTDAIAALGGLPHLEALLLEKCRLGPGWAEAVGGLRTLRWLTIHGRWWSEDLPLPQADARQLGRLERLSHLRLGAVVLDVDALDELPRSVEVLRLSGGQPLTEAFLRRLRSRTRLRGLEVGTVAPGCEPMLCEAVATLPLERFGSDRPLSPELWRVVRELPHLRRLAIECGDTVVDAVARCAKLPTLEAVDLRARELPCRDDLAALAALPALREVDVYLMTRGATPEDVQRLSGCLGPHVRVDVH